MNDYIRRAFKSLEDLQVVIEPVKSTLKEDLEIETEIKEEPKTVRDLFESERSYIITHDFEDDGISYSLFLEALNDGESCDIEFEVFDIENITEVLVEVLDSEHEFLGSLAGEDITLDTPFEKVIKEAKAFINGEELPDEEEVVIDTEVSSEEPEANDREFISDEVEVTEEELLTEEDKDCENCCEDKDCEDSDCKDEECCDEECKECKEKSVKEDLDLHPIKITDEDRFGSAAEVEKYKNKIKKLAAKYGAEVEFKTKVGPKRLDSSWYGGKHVALINIHNEETNKDYIIDVIGENAEPYVHFSDTDQELNGIKEFEDNGYFNDATFPEVDGIEVPAFYFRIRRAPRGRWYDSFNDLDWDLMWDLDSALDIESYVEDVIPTLESDFPERTKRTKKDESLKEGKDEIEEYLEVLVIDGKDISCIDTFDVEDVQEAIAAAKEAGADKVVRVTRINKADGSFDFDDKKERVIWTKENNINEEQLSESKKYDLYDDEEVEEADKDLDELKNSTSKDEIMQIVDASAESTDELRDSYIGGMVLQCPVCKATMFKDMDQLVKEEDTDLYNVEEECPHCGSKGGFELIGQLAKPDVNPFAEEEAPVEEPVEEKEEVKIEAEPLPELPSEEESEEEVTELDLGKQESLQKTGNVILESLDESKFDRLVIKYLKETYTNIRSYKTTDAAVDDNNNKIIIEGLITFNSGKEKKTTFVFEAKEITNKNQLKLVGMNETFTTGKAFTLLAGTENGRLLSESLSYRYTIDDKKVKGKATSFQKR